MKRNLIVILSALLALSFYSCKSSSYASKSGMDKTNPAYTGKGGESRPVEVKGIAQITSSGEQEAFERAVAHAMREAIEQVLGTMVESSTLVENGKLVQDEIYSKASGFVERYNVLEDTRDGKTKIVRIKAWVVVGDVKDNARALGLIQDRVGRPYVMVLIDEKAVEGGEPTMYAKNALHQKLMEKEFKFVDEGQLKKVLASRNLQVSQLTGVSDEILAKVAIDAGAQMLIKGKVSTAKQDTANITAMANTGFKSVRSTVSIDVVYAADATIIASESSQMPAAKLDFNSAQADSIKKAVDDLAPRLVDKILKQWDNMVNNGFEYDVVIAGVEFGETTDIKSALEKNIEGVKKVFEKGYNNSTLTLLVRFSGTSTDLARMLVAQGKIPVALAVKNVSSKSITLSKK